MGYLHFFDLEDAAASFIDRYSTSYKYFEDTAGVPCYKSTTSALQSLRHYCVCEKNQRMHQESARMGGNKREWLASAGGCCQQQSVVIGD